LARFVRSFAYCHRWMSARASDAKPAERELGGDRIVSVREAADVDDARARRAVGLDDARREVGRREHEQRAEHAVEAAERHARALDAVL
jgi:hypothetical protein